MQKKILEILVLTALTVGLIWTILELNPKVRTTVINYTVVVRDPTKNHNDISTLCFSCRKPNQHPNFMSNSIQTLT